MDSPLRKWSATGATQTDNLKLESNPENLVVGRATRGRILQN